MEYLEFEKRLHSLKEGHKKEIVDLKRVFAESNRKYTVGDVLETKSCGIVKVTKLGITTTSIFGNEAQCQYIGISLKKTNLEPYKNGNIEAFGQCQVIRIIQQRDEELPETTLFCE